MILDINVWTLLNLCQNYLDFDPKYSILRYINII